MSGGPRKLSELLAAAGQQANCSSDPVIVGVCTLENGSADKLAWCGSAKYIEAAKASRAAAVLAPLNLAGELTNGVAVANPQQVFVAIAALFAPDDRPDEGVHPSASVDASASLGASLRIGPHVSIGPRARIGAGCSLDAGVVIGADAVIGDGGQIGARVVVAPRSQIGDRVLILPGAVIGSRGFGNVHDGEAWRPIPQLGKVQIGNDVEIGANTTIDCGALDDTCIGDNVRIDNQCQIAHNVKIGAQTALAAQVGIAGSATIGAGCLLGGQVGVAGHIQIADRVILSGGAIALQSITQAGQYGSGSPLLPVKAFARLLALLRRLEPRLKALERAKRSEQ